eukprot:scaffold1722_cov120-Cylindrotheca_fusiformis.AAC.11
MDNLLSLIPHYPHVNRASFADSPTAVLPAIWWIVAMGAANGYSFQLIAKTCSMTSSVTYREAWKDSKLKTLKLCLDV